MRHKLTSPSLPAPHPSFAPISGDLEQQIHASGVHACVPHVVLRFVLLLGVSTQHRIEIGESLRSNSWVLYPGNLPLILPNAMLKFGVSEEEVGSEVIIG